MLVVIDNYDSFTYNLVQYLGEMGANLQVFRNDDLSVTDLKQMQPEAVVISPGPGRPEDAGISLDLIRELGPVLPILGVCLGHQCIGQVYGGQIVRAPELMHGKTSQIYHQGVGVFEGLSQPFTATRYHSLVIDPSTCPPELEVTAQTHEGVIMGVRHRRYLHIQGVQFHPESILTAEGKQLLRNFLQGAQAFAIQSSGSSTPFREAVAVVPSGIPCP
ncbi:anthranilate synthase component II [Thermostichus vulcanus]|uniref:Aminodeoxychorismate/anthranilate synthase component II n=1 Tax=Thermostichus vulcanus str. 'Rupite' TaxID=2813851 RepID=A0ABT0C8B7_THEVL|nr:aminodeoxychorismate/anthranilate synthase component II [Thermostichus vulcanus str. 'Rupite']